MDWPSSLPWQRIVNFTRKVQYPTKFFFVARTADDKRLEITAPKLSKDQEAPLAIGGQMETRTVNAIGRPMGGAPVLKDGDDLVIQVSSPVNPLFWGFLAFLVLFCLAIPFALLRKSTPCAPESSKIEEPAIAGSVYPRTFATDGPIEFSAIASGIIERIAGLDVEFGQGKIAETEYSRQRSQLKKQVVEQMLQNEAPQPETKEQQAN